MNKIAKERIVFQNYDLSGYEEMYKEEHKGEDFDENEMYEYISSLLDWDFHDFMGELKSFFRDKMLIAFGKVGRWDGVYDGGKVCPTFEDLFYRAMKGSDYFKLYDENGHLFLLCIGHDGNSLFEIKELTKEGEDYYDRWEYSGYSDKRTEKDCHNQIIKKYSKLPNLMHKLYGAKLREYVEPTKEVLSNKLGNRAVSHYS